MTDQKFAPLIGPWTGNTGITDKGALVAMFRVQGLPSDLADASQIAAAHAAYNHNAVQLSHPDVEWWTHLTRMEIGGMTPLPPCDGWFARRFDAAYEQCLGGGLYQNDIYFTVIKRPPVGLKSGLRRVAGMLHRSPLKGVKIPSAEQAFLEDFNDLATRVEGALGSQGVVRLRLEERDGGWFDEQAEALHVIMNNFWRPIPVSRGRASYNATPYLLHFGDNAMAIHTAAANPRYAVMLGLKNYPVWTNPKMFDALHAAKFSFTLTNSMLFTRRSLSLKALADKLKTMSSSNDVAGDDIREVAVAENRLASGYTTWGSHHASLAVHSRVSLEDLDRKTVAAETILSNAQINPVRESKAIKPAYYAQSPGNARWRTRPNPIPAEIFADFAALHGVPRGRYKGRWGAPIVNLVTTADTEYHFHFQVQGSAQIPKEDLGSMLVMGPSGSGKAQPLDAKVLTPTGFQRMGDLSVGDLVITPDGKVAPIIGVFPQGEKEIYRITFYDGRTTECCDDHLWKVWEAFHAHEAGPHKTRKAIPGGGRWRVWTTAEVRKRLAKGGRSAAATAIPLVAHDAVEMPPQDLPIPPYALGAILGDACLRSSVLISTPDSHVLDRVLADLPEYKVSKVGPYEYRLALIDRVPYNKGKTHHSVDDTTTCYIHEQSGELFVVYGGKSHTLAEWAMLVGTNRHALRKRLFSLGWTAGEALGFEVRARPTPQANTPLNAAIKALGLKDTRSHTKFVPEIYKRGSVAQRIALLQGLMDTDGSVGNGTHATFTSTSEQLAKDVQELAWSLGGIASIHPRQTYHTYKGVRKAGKPSWRVSIVHPDISIMFSLPRHVANCAPKVMRHRLRIASVEPIGRKPAQCIAVDHPDNLYVTDNYIVTHNTSLVASLVMLSQRQGARVVVVDKDFGLAPMVNANDGAYLDLADGEPSLAPLRALTSTPRHIAYLTSYIRMLIMSDGQGEISSEEDQRLPQLVELQMSMPPEMREMAGIAVGLGQKDRNGARARLKKWCWGERLGWAVDGRKDRLDTSKQMMGYDTTSLLKNEEACSPILNHLFYRTSELIDGTPIVFLIDEMWAVDKNPAFAADNNDKLTTIRKNEGVVILATQSARTALASPNAHTLIQQIPTKIWFADDSLREQDADGFGLTQRQRWMIRVGLGAQRHRFMITRPGGEAMVCGFDLSKVPGKIAVMSGRRSTYDLMNELKAQYGDRPENWVPHYERLAPGLVDKPVTRKPKLEVVS